MTGHGETYLYGFFDKDKMTNEVANVLQTEFGIDVSNFCSRRNKKQDSSVTIPAVSKTTDSLEDKIYRAVLKALKEAIG